MMDNLAQGYLHGLISTYSNWNSLTLDSWHLDNHPWSFLD